MGPSTVVWEIDQWEYDHRKNDFSVPQHLSVAVALSKGQSFSSSPSYAEILATLTLCRLPLLLLLNGNLHPSLF